MARYDKYDPISGGFRGLLNADLTLTDGSFMGAVSLNASGRVVVGTAGQSGLVGVVVKNAAKGPIGQYGTSLQGGTPVAYAPVGALAGDVVDIMTSGEIVDLDTTDFPAGTEIFSDAAGALSTTNTGTKVGWTVEAGRLIVRIAAPSA
jgi:hypothetical protein